MFGAAIGNEDYPVVNHLSFGCIPPNITGETPTLLPLEKIIDVQLSGIAYARSETKVYMWGNSLCLLAVDSSQEEFFSKNRLPLEIPLLTAHIHNFVATNLSLFTLHVAMKDGNTYSFGPIPTKFELISVHRAPIKVDLMNANENLKKALVPTLVNQGVSKILGKSMLLFFGKHQMFSSRFRETLPLPQTLPFPVDPYNEVSSSRVCTVLYHRKGSEPKEFRFSNSPPT